MPFIIGLNHTHHRVRSNSCIHRIPAALQHPHPSLRRHGDSAATIPPREITIDRPATDPAQ